jgi:hypothetical protein
MTNNKGMEIEQIERLIYKSADDIAIGTARSFERFEERLDAMESRLYSRIADLENEVALARADITGKFDGLGREIVGQVSEINQRLTELLQLS